MITNVYVIFLSLIVGYIRFKKKVKFTPLQFVSINK